jgi:hypothetical protein
MENSVALAAIGLAGSTIAGLIWVVKYLAKTLSADLQEHTKAALAQTNASNEVLMFMKNLNGELKKAAQKKLQ